METKKEGKDVKSLFFSDEGWTQAVSPAPSTCQWKTGTTMSTVFLECMLACSRSLIEDIGSTLGSSRITPGLPLDISLIILLCPHHVSVPKYVMGTVA